MRAFGIGCLWFGRKLENATEDEDPTKHFEAVRHALEAIPNLEDVEVSVPDRIVLKYSGFDEIGDVDHFNPLVLGVIIRFRVHLPKRIQDQLLVYRESLAESEDFWVSIHYGTEAPTAIISYDASDPPRKPSDAVVVVRKYLEQQFERIENVGFGMLGPSPFHADFVFREGSVRGDGGKSVPVRV